jgi:hypothetical protein
MSDRTFQKVWRIPLVLGCCVMLGLLAALLGTGGWYGISWTAMTLPLLVAAWKIARKKTRRQPNT